MDFLEFLNTNIEQYIKEKNSKMLTAFRNIKSEYVYEQEKSKLSDDELIKKMYNKRRETAAIYLDTNADLYEAENLEMNILHPFLKKEPSQDEVMDFLKTLNTEKNVKNFKVFQMQCQEKFGQKVNSEYIIEYINS